MSEKSKSEIVDRLLLLQGIDSIENGLQYIEWLNGMLPDALTEDALKILRDRFQYFKDCALSDGRCDYLIIDKMNDHNDNIQHNFELRKKVKKQLGDYRQAVVNEVNSKDL